MCPPALQLFNVNKLPSKLFADVIECFLPVSAQFDCKLGENCQKASTDNTLDFQDKRIHHCLKYLSEHPFSKIDMDKMKTLTRFSEIIKDISEYYVPCKAKKYIPSEQVTILTKQKSITVLRQILRLHGYQLLGKQVYIGNGVPKQVIYWVGILGTVQNEDMIHYAIPPIDYRKTLSDLEKDKINSHQLLSMKNTHVKLQFS
jgi:hypothetical protein